MATPAAVRLDRLFAKLARPPLADSNEPHIADTELESKSTTDEKNHQSVGKSPDAIRSACEPLRSNLDIGQLTSSDDDDEYVALFNTKPAMATNQMKLGVQEKRHRPPALSCYEQLDEKEENRLVQSIPRGKRSAHTDSLQTEDDNVWVDKRELPKADENGNPVSGHFCVFQLLAKFPYKYMDDANDRVSRHFFANNKFYQRKWELWYMQLPPTMASSAILLVPHSQAQTLIDEISTVFQVDLFVPPDPFTMTFFHDGTPQPRLLGTSSCRDDVNSLQALVPTPADNYGEPPANATAALRRSFEDWHKRNERAIAAKKGANARNKKKKAEQRIQDTRDWVAQVNRAQRYLGLRPRATNVVDPDPKLSWAEQEEFRIQQSKKSGLILDPLDVNKLAPHAFDKSVVIISFDVEAWEREPRPITEIGVSTLDTLDLVDIAPGPGGENWMKQIRSRHFRIREYVQFRNKDFCFGDPEHFLFGKSEFVAREDAARIVDDCFEYPFSAQYKHSGSEAPTTLEDLPDSSASTQLPDGTESDTLRLQKGSRERFILVLGHDTKQDIRYLQKLGSEIFSSSNEVFPMPPALANGTGRASVLASFADCPFDTAILDRVIAHKTQSRSLGTILTELGRTGWGLHNGGNDARYTLECFIGLTIKARLQWDKKQELRQLGVQADPEWEDEKARRVDASIKQAVASAMLENQILDAAVAAQDIEDGRVVIGHDLESMPTVENGLVGCVVDEHGENVEADEVNTAEEKVRGGDLPVRPRQVARRSSSDWEL